MEFYNQLFSLILFYLVCFLIIIPFAYLAGYMSKKRRLNRIKNAYKYQTNFVSRTTGKTVVFIENNVITDVINSKY